MTNEEFYNHIRYSTVKEYVDFIDKFKNEFRIMLNNIKDKDKLLNHQIEYLHHDAFVMFNSYCLVVNHDELKADKLPNKIIINFMLENLKEARKRTLLCHNLTIHNFLNVFENNIIDAINEPKIFHGIIKFIHHVKKNNTNEMREYFDIASRMEEQLKNADITEKEKQKSILEMVCTVVGVMELCLFKNEYGYKTNFKDPKILLEENNLINNPKKMN